MKTLKYAIIKTEQQYNSYCNALEELLGEGNKTAFDEIELLNLLIEKWDKEHNTLSDLNPIEILQSLMADHQLKPKDLGDIIGLSKGTISKMLNYQKGLSKDTIRKLADYFKVSQELFNRSYKLKNDVNRHFRNASLMDTKKDLGKEVRV
jgi:HTH-type transcriptional regulator/antitoxin HigA